MKLNFDNPQSEREVKLAIYYQMIQEENRKGDQGLPKFDGFLLKVKKALLKVVIKLDRTLIINAGDRFRLQVKQEIESITKEMKEIENEFNIQLGQGLGKQNKDKIELLANLAMRKNYLEGCINLPSNSR